MISREDFIFTVGFSGNTAIVSKSMKSKYKKLSARELAEAGFFKPAVFMAYYDERDDEMQEVLEYYNRGNAYPVETTEKLQRTFGILENLDDVNQVMYI